MTRQRKQGGLRLAVDIGGTFTDVALSGRGRLWTFKTLTTHAAPSEGVMTGIERVLGDAQAAPGDLEILIHGTTLATNALIERRGAKTALLTTEGHRDALEMAHENRFEQYDINVDRRAPLVPRRLRLPIRERMDRAGRPLIPLHEADVEAAVAVLDAHEVESVAVGYLHAYANADHEKRTAEILARLRPELSITLAAETCPEIREYERLSTACANAYVRPLMETYLRRLERDVHAKGVDCPLLLMTSGGGLTTLETAARFPIRLVESGPAGGAILAQTVAEAAGLDRVLSFDMGGTTAKLCLIDDGAPLMSRAFEVDRAYRFKKGSGLPVRIPVIEMVEIGAGGGSLAHVDAMGRLRIGPESAGSEPGPAAYGRGGTRATVTDADVALGRIVAERFAGGLIALDAGGAAAALAADVGAPLGLAGSHAALGVAEMVEENMASAARAHAAEWGKEAAGRAMVAFGGAAPLHAARLAEKLGVDCVMVPADAGVGSAVGFLLAPVAYEVVRSRYMRLSDYDPAEAAGVFDEMRAEARPVVEAGAPGADFAETRKAFMRYMGQGYEIAVDVAGDALERSGAPALRAAFDKAYAELYGRTIPGLDVEILSWTLALTEVRTDASAAVAAAPTGGGRDTALVGRQRIVDPVTAEETEAPIYERAALAPGDRLDGPALIAEDQTTTVVTAAFCAHIDERGAVVLTRKPEDARG